MFVPAYVSAQEILESPEIMDRIEEPYVIVSYTNSSIFGNARKLNQSVIDAVNLIYWQGWETVNFTFVTNSAQMLVMVKNPRPRRKNQPNQG